MRSISTAPPSASAVTPTVVQAGSRRGPWGLLSEESIENLQDLAEPTGAVYPVVVPRPGAATALADLARSALRIDGASQYR